MTDKKDFIIELLRQQREEAQNRTVTVTAEANAKIAELSEEIEKLKAEVERLKAPMPKAVAE